MAHASKYEATRNLPSQEGTSRLSPHLHFGEVSPAAVWHSGAGSNGSVGTFLGELGWRDYAQNVIVQLPDYGAVNWQWAAGSGIDAQMFVRIMAPLSQSAKFDAAGYIREWVPALAHLPDGDIHDPVFEVPGYPAKLIGHAEARARALEAWSKVKE